MLVLLAEGTEPATFPLFPFQLNHPTHIISLRFVLCIIRLLFNVNCIAKDDLVDFNITNIKKFVIVSFWFTL